MSNLSEIVDSLENRVSNLLQYYKKLRGEKLKIEEELAVLKSQQSQYKKEIDEWREECSSLKLANSVLGSDDYKRETKLKINELVREIDKCIVQLSE
jgi:chromosome segregation ATPase